LPSRWLSRILPIFFPSVTKPAILLIYDVLRKGELCSLVVGKVDGCVYMCSWEVELISFSSWNIFCRLQRSIQIWDMVSDKENLEIWSIQFSYTFYSSCLTDVVDSVRLWALACWQNVFAMSHKQVKRALHFKGYNLN
jgi:hypothetical protein